LAPSLTNGRDISITVGDTLSSFAVASNTGGSASFSISPALPAGLVLNPADGTVSGTATAYSATSPYTVTATNTSGSSSVQISVTVLKRNQEINVTLPEWVTYGDGNIAVNPSATSGLVVAYSSSNSSILRLNADGTLSPVGAGTATITFQQAGDATYNAAPVKRLDVTVRPRSLNLTGITVSVDKNGNVTFTGGNLDGILPGDLVGVNGSGVTGSYSNNTLNQNGRFTLTGKDAANYVLNQPSAYDVRVETSNGSGESLWQPLDAIPVASQPANGKGSVGGIDISVLLRANTGRNGLELLGSGWQLGLGATDTNGKLISLGSDGTLRIQRDHTFLATGAGFAPNTNVKLYIFSNPISLGQVSTDARGSFETAVAVPDSLESGLHTFQAVGYSPTGQIQMGDIPVTLVDSINTVSIQKVTGIIYFKPGTYNLLKRSQPSMNKMLSMLGGPIANPKVDLKVFNSRKDINPSALMAVRRLKIVMRSLRSKIATTSISTGVGTLRRQHWGYVRYTVTYQK